MGEFQNANRFIHKSRKHILPPLYNFFHKKEIVQGFLMYNEFATKHYKGK